MLFCLFTFPHAGQRKCEKKPPSLNRSQGSEVSFPIFGPSLDSINRGFCRYEFLLPPDTLGSDEKLQAVDSNSTVVAANSANASRQSGELTHIYFLLVVNIITGGGGK